MSGKAPVAIAYFSDVLCVWAYVAQIRLDEIASRFGDEVDIEYRFLSVFGDSANKIARNWADKGGYEGFNRHVREVAARYDHIEVHPNVWLTTRPASSDSAHLFIKAVQVAQRRAAGPDTGRVGEAGGACAQLIWRLRCAFFRECRNISLRSVQREVAEQVGIALAPVEAEIESGAAFAALASDHQVRERLRLEGSPTYVLNQGRQKLYGNLGYRVIEANIRELLRAPGPGEMSWC